VLGSSNAPSAGWATTDACVAAYFTTLYYFFDVFKPAYSTFFPTSEYDPTMPTEIGFSELDYPRKTIGTCCCAP